MKNPEKGTKEKGDVSVMVKLERELNHRFTKAQADYEYEKRVKLKKGEFAALMIEKALKLKDLGL